MKYTLLLVLLSLSACAAPSKMWVGAGSQALEIGAVMPFNGSVGSAGFSLETAVEPATVSKDHIARGKKVRCDPGTDCREVPKDRAYSADDDAVRGRLGIRWDLYDFAHVAAGVNEELGAYARAGLEYKISRSVGFGVDLVEDRGEEVLFGVRFSR